MGSFASASGPLAAAADAWRAPIVSATTGEGIPIAITVVATVIVVALLSVLVAAVRAGRRLRASAEILDAEVRATLRAVDGTLAHASAELERVDDLIGSAEQLTETVGTASRMAFTALASPLIKVMAIWRGTARATQRLRKRPGSSRRR